MTTDTPSTYSVVISYDFGTTYSGAAYALIHNAATEVYDIQKWPNKGGNFYPKVPSLSVYHKSDPHTLSKWGFAARKVLSNPQTAKENIILSNFKLNLDETLHRGLAENGKSNVSNIADYLKALHTYSLEELKRGFAKNYPETSFCYCLTVPAIWSDYAKQSMRRAAIQAGIIHPSDPEHRLVLISEPEAAALYCERMCDMVNLKENDKIMVCDAGGGTVDLIAFEVINGNTQSGNRLKEIAKGMGKSCGSVFLDINFRALVRAKLGDQFDSLPVSTINSIMDQFIDTIKPEFDGIDDHYLLLPAAVKLDEICEEDVCLDEGALTLKAAELEQKVFQPVIQKILELLEEQYNSIPNRQVSTLFVVGGFGSSHYLLQKIKDSFENRINQILCPPRAALAVVRGAAYFGLNPKIITSRISRRTYGINAGLPFDEGRDPIESRVVRPDGTVRCTSRFLEFVKKGDAIPIDHCIREEMIVYYDTVKTTDIILYSTVNDKTPRYYDEPGVVKVAALSVPIPYMPTVGYGTRLIYKNVLWVDRDQYGS
ncbi:hypothetical protein BDB01DRAFT_96694 [Pilobolus umbonatus]|nr:hypothetical protein BDB01DRAFT_96694 [Pilobolus umbonatus]